MLHLRHYVLKLIHGQPLCETLYLNFKIYQNYIKTQCLNFKTRPALLCDEYDIFQTMSYTFKTLLQIIKMLVVCI